MKMIDVLGKLANGEIKDKSTLLVESGEETFEYVYYERHQVFRGRCCSTLEDDFGIDKNFLNLEVELVEPKEKKYLIVLKARGVRHVYNYVHYCRDEYLQWIEFGGTEFDGECEGISRKVVFTKKEMQEIDLLKMFLEDMGGTLELVEAD